MVKYLSYSSNVTIKSLDPANPAVLTDLQVLSSKNVTFDNLEFDRSVSTDSFAYRVTSSENVTFSNLDVHGTLDNNVTNDQDAFLVRTSKNVTITGSEFHELAHAINHLDNNGFTVTDSKFHDLRSDGVFGGGTSNVLIARNTFTNFYPNAVDHPDAIQFWATTLNPVMTNIVVVDNIVAQGDGGGVQGVFFRNMSGVAFDGVTIRGNQIQGGMGNGIYVEGGRNLVIDDNTIGRSVEVNSWIRVVSSDMVSVTGNVTPKFIYETVTNLTEAGNTLSSDATVTLIDPVVGVVEPIVEPVVEPVVEPSTDVSSSVSYTLAEGQLNLTLTGTSAINGTGNGSANMIVGNDAANVLSGGAGADTLSAGAGADVLEGGGGNDVIDGGAGLDTVSYASVAESVIVDLSLASAQATGAGGTDTLYNIENVTGGAYRDTLKGNAAGNVLNGGAGSDSLTGGGGADSLFGGAGADYFVYTALSDSTSVARDKIYDFKSSEGDRIDLRAIDAKLGGANDAFSLVNRFTKKAGQLTVSQDGDHWVVSADVNGDAVADFSIDVYATVKPVSGDFLL